MRLKKVFRSINRSNLLPSLLLAMIVAGGIFCIFIFSAGLFSYDVYDYFEGVFWADASIRSHSLINPDFLYYYVLPFGSNVIMAPFVYLFGTSCLANQLGMLVFFLLYLAAAFLLAKALFPRSRKSRLLFVSVTSLFVYTYIGDNLLHHLLMYGIGLVCMMGELACLIEINRKKRSAAHMILLAILCLWSAVNGFSAVLSSIPVLAALLITGFRNGTLSKKENAVPAAVMLTTTAVGLLLFMHLNASALSQNMYEKRFVLDSVDNVVVNLTHNLPVSYLKLFHFSPNSDPLISLNGFFMLISLLFAVSVIALPLFLKSREKSPSDPPDEPESLLVLSNLFIILISLVQFALVTTSSLRYLFNGVLSVFIICAYRFTRFTGKGGGAVPLIPLIILVAVMSVKMVAYTYPHESGIKKGFEQVSDVLKQEGLSYGYAMNRYWTTLDVVSEGSCSTSIIAADVKTEKLVVRKDRVYLEELKKPEGIDRYYIIAFGQELEDNEEYLSGWTECQKVWNANILIYDFASWDDMFVEG